MIGRWHWPCVQMKKMVRLTAPAPVDKFNRLEHCNFMSDMTLCLDKKCQSKNHCLRHTSTPNLKWQFYATFGRVEGENKCGGYVEIFHDVKRKSFRKYVSGYKSTKNKAIQITKLDIFC